MKKFLKGFFAFIVTCGLIGVFIGYMLSKVPVMTLGAKGFLIAVSSGQYQQAYALLTPEFQKTTDFESFKENVKITGLDQYKNIVWLKNEVFPQQQGGVVLGRLITKDNHQFLVQFEFKLLQGEKKTQKSWLISSIRFPKDEHEAETSQPQIKYRQGP
ncbi:MAG: hypothetical protein JSR17_11615 [Proteobacteria bacterium]|nr:hypothetical protein [Pseudomonadota bacterium]